MNKINATGRKAMAKLIGVLTRGVVSEEPADGPHVGLRTVDGRLHLFAADLLGEALSLGLAAKGEGGLRASAAARSYLRRAASERDEAFLEQHGDIAEVAADVEGVRQQLRVNRSESPLASMMRLKEKNGSPFLPAEAIAAGERLLADFTRGQLQPRVTASWEPRLSGRAKGARGGMADLTDGAMTGRLAVNRALEAIGPELSGVALDICCFMKGLETVEHERQWPARSAKLMLRTALMALSRHYNPQAPSRHARMEHWGAEGYRPAMGY